MPTCINAWKWVFAGIMMISLMGCGDSHQTVSGDVTFDGQIVDEGMIVFVPANAESKQPKVPVQIINGKYTVEATRGLTAGKYKVEITWMRKTGKKVSTADGPEMREERQQALPAQFNTATTLTAEIPAPSNKLDFTLSAK